MTSIYLKRGKDESLRRYHPWIFSGAIHHIDGKVAEGDVVDVYDAEHAYICTGHYQIGSITVRVLTFEKRDIDESFYAERIGEALAVRRSIGLVRADNNTYRLVHGEGDFLPGLVIDIYNRTAVVQAHSVGMHVHREMIAKAIVTVFGNDVTSVFYKSETTLPFKADLGQENGFLIGGTEIDNIAIENGLKFHIDWLGGQKTGFFVDQRDNRSLIEHYAKGRRLLNMFCYTGGFSVYAMRGGAVKVDSVDASAKAVELVNQNMELNFPGDTRHAAYAQDAFAFLDKMEKSAYDLIILDPPAFAKHRDAVRAALKGYTRLNARAMEKIEKGGLLFTFSCSQAVDKDHFRAAVFTAATQAHRRVRILHQLHQPADHPINIYHPEGEYLKGLVLEVE